MAARHHYTKQHQRWKKKGPFRTKTKHKLQVSPGGCALGLLTSVTFSPNHPQSQRENALTASQVWAGPQCRAHPPECQALLPPRAALASPPSLAVSTSWASSLKAPALSKLVVVYKGPQGLTPMTTASRWPRRSSNWKRAAVTEPAVSSVPLWPQGHRWRDMNTEPQVMQEQLKRRTVWGQPLLRSPSCPCTFPGLWPCDSPWPIQVSCPLHRHQGWSALEDCRSCPFYWVCPGNLLLQTPPLAEHVKIPAAWGHVSPVDDLWGKTDALSGQRAPRVYLSGTHLSESEPHLSIDYPDWDLLSFLFSL